MMLRTLSLGILLSAVSVFAQYKTEPAGSPPADLAASASGLLQKDGVKITGPDGKVLCEIWLRSAMPSGPKLAEENLTLPTVPQGSLLAAIRFPAQHADRRGQGVKPGLYTMRFSFFPQNGDHQGVAPQRDFLILSQAAVDTGGDANPSFDALMAMSRKASGTPHPLVFSMWKDEPDAKPGFEKQGENDWVLHVKIGTVPVAIILVGKAEG
jgi:hypothetical protein